MDILESAVAQAKTYWDLYTFAKAQNLHPGEFNILMAELRGLYLDKRKKQGELHVYSKNGPSGPSR